MELATQRPHLTETEEQEIHGGFLSITAKQGPAEQMQCPVCKWQPRSFWTMTKRCMMLKLAETEEKINEQFECRKF